MLVPEEQEEPPITLYSWTITELDPPETTILLGPDPAVPSISTTATFAIQSDEAVSTFECSLDNAGFAACPDPAVYTGLADGPHTFEARATDAAGNVDPTPASWTWTVAADRTAPTTTILDGPDAETTLVDASFTFVSNEPGSTFECSLDSEPLASCESPAEYTDLALGEHTFRVRATDVARERRDAGEPTRGTSSSTRFRPRPRSRDGRPPRRSRRSRRSASSRASSTRRSSARSTVSRSPSATRRWSTRTSRSARTRSRCARSTSRATRISRPRATPGRSRPCPTPRRPTRGS